MCPPKKFVWLAKIVILYKGLCLMQPLTCSSLATCCLAFTFASVSSLDRSLDGLHDTPSMTQIVHGGQFV